ncbi:unnamed protein product [Rhizophagus irregularis]|nr:unnamed protein product [Rhizophagus irregularis]
MQDIDLNNITIKEIIRELKIQREVDFHDNFIRCYGITKLESENENNYCGKPPFYVEDEQYDIGLALEISQGLRETIVPDTPDEYVKIYTRCWGGEPDNRPTIYQLMK